MTDPDVEIHEDSCPACAEPTTLQRECYECGGEGGFDGFEEDPLWYDEGDIEPCDLCFGHGWMHWCGKCGHDFLAPKRLALPVTDGVNTDEGTQR